MMKKTLMTSAVAAALIAGSAQAATIYESDDGATRLDNYGRIILALQNADGDNEIIDPGSRLGFRAFNQINDDLRAFARAEMRFDASEAGRQEINIRNTYVGVQGDFGKVTFGNFDSIYYQAVSGVKDLYEVDGFQSFNTGSRHARGDSIAFETADLGGMQFGLAAKHYVVGEDDDREEEWNLQAYGKFTMVDNLTLAVGFDQNNEDTGAALANGDGDFDPIIGFSAEYDMGDLTPFALFEISGDLMHFALGGTYTYGPGDIYGSLSWLDNDGDNGVEVALGANYKFSSAFRTFAEVVIGDEDHATSIGDQTNFALGGRFDW